MPTVTNTGSRRIQRALLSEGTAISSKLGSTSTCPSYGSFDCTILSGSQVTERYCGYFCMVQSFSGGECWGAAVSKSSTSPCLRFALCRRGARHGHVEDSSEG